MSSPSWLVITFLILGRLVTVLKYLPSTSFEIFKTIYSLFLASTSTRGGVAFRIYKHYTLLIK